MRFLAKIERELATEVNLSDEVRVWDAAVSLE